MLMETAYNRVIQHVKNAYIREVQAFASHAQIRVPHWSKRHRAQDLGPAYVGMGLSSVSTQIRVFRA